MFKMQNIIAVETRTPDLRFEDADAPTESFSGNTPTSCRCCTEEKAAAVRMVGTLRADA